MFSAEQYKGSSLGNKTICLTFDDGPGQTAGNGKGPKTLRLASYLHEQGITATFFVVGKFAKEYSNILSELKRLNHIIGNHTYSHPNLGLSNLSDQELIFEFTATTSLITENLTNENIFFRAPFTANVLQK